MIRSKGKSVYRGIAIGTAIILEKNNHQIKRYKIENTESETERINKAVKQAQEQLKNLYEKAVREVGTGNAAIFEVHQMLLEDEDYLESVYNMIRKEKVNADYAVAVTGDNFSAMFSEMNDDYMKERAADFKDISNRLINCLNNRKEISLDSEEPVIIVADDLSPSETLQMDKSKIKAFVTVKGSTNSHTAILARMMNIPALVNVALNFDEIQSGMNVIVDGFKSEVIFEPTEEIISQALLKMSEDKENQQLLQKLKGKENITLDGKKINIYANIGSVGDVAYVLENDADGIGLFRSEFLYIGRINPPSEDEQFQIYKKIIQTMAEKKVIIRTLDIGADKKADYLGLEKEENPAMGYRAIRICLSQPEIFKTQLRAVFRSAVYGNISIMYPMITSIEEVLKISEITEEVKTELEKAKIPYKIPEQGIMIETPAAVMISDELAELVDFFSIGTNDLTQYTLAVDRQNEKIEDFYNPYHKAILKMIKIVIDNAHKHGKWVGICGELGADTKMTEKFVRMGIDELSVAPAMVLKVRKKVREIYFNPEN